MHNEAAIKGKVQNLYKKVSTTSNNKKNGNKFSIKCLCCYGVWQAYANNKPIFPSTFREATHTKIWIQIIIRRCNSKQHETRKKGLKVGIFMKINILRVYCIWHIICVVCAKYVFVNLHASNAIAQSCMITS